ncbi:MAG: hypothetical protein AMXMBFR23_18470 [Chloroflexota bacterium]
MSRSARRFGRRRFLALGAGVVGGVLLGACGADEEAPAATATAVSTGIVRLRTRDVPPGTPRQTSALSLGTLRGPSVEMTDREQFLVYSRLVAVDPRTASVFGDLANSVEVLEPLVVRIALRPGSFFHPALSGGEAKPVTAEAVAIDFERRRSEGVFLFRDVIQQVEARGEHQLVLRLAAPFGLLFEYLSRPDASIRGAARYSAFDAPVGSGPFVPALVEGRDRLYAANPLLTGGLAPRLGQVLVRGAASEGELDAMFGSGEVHVRMHPDAASREHARGLPDRVEVSRPAQVLRGLAFSLLAHGDDASRQRAEFFQDQRVRRAAAFALDHDAIRAIDDAYLSGPVGPAHAGDALSEEELSEHPLYQHDPAEARALLSAAGALDLPLRLSHPDGSAMLPVAAAVAEQLQRAGFAPRLQPMGDAEFEAALGRGDFETAVFDLEGIETPDLGLRLHTTGGLDGQRSPWGYSNPVYDAAVTAALSELDPLHRARRSREAQRLLLDDVPAMIPLAAPRQYASLQSGVEGFEYDAYAFNEAYLASAWTGPVQAG